MPYNIYCDESCHLEHDKNDIFVVGGISCPREQVSKINEKIIKLKIEYGYDPKSEIKWTKIAPCNVKFYLALVDFFFNNKDLQFRGYIGRGKSQLNHAAHNQSYDDWYYKMYYRMLEFLLDKDKQETFSLYLDIKDTQGAKKIKKIKNYLNAHFSKEIVEKIQLVRSDEVALLQITDLFIGALSYKHRRLRSSSAKLEVINHIEELSKHNLMYSCPVKEKKANWFVWVPDHWR